MNGRLSVFIVAPLLACATPGSSGSSRKVPAGVEERASCLAGPPEGGIVRSEQELTAWLAGAGEPRDEGLPDMFGGGPCDREMIGEIDWSTQHLAFWVGSSGGWIERMSIRGSTLVIFQEIERQCGGMEVPMFQPGTSVVVVPAKVEAIEWKNHSELCDWEKKGLGPPP